MDNFFMPLGNDKPQLKVALEGFAGSGKTHTAALIAIGLHKRIGSNKPVVFFDTEKAAKFLKAKFDQAGIEVLVKPSRSMSDLKQAMKFCREGGSDVLIIDSISHIWDNFLEAYKEKVGGRRLQFQDWGIIKPSWKAEFSDPFVNDPYHVIMCGRAGYEYESEINADTNRREIFKSGVKMKVEGETAYEPDLLLLMNRFEDVLDKHNKEIWREATVIKDRADIIDGQTFKNPTYEDFKPVVEALLADPTEATPAREGDDKKLFKTEEDKAAYGRLCKIAQEEIAELLIKAYPSTKQEAKAAKADILEEVFSTRSWKKVESLHLEALEQGAVKVKEVVDRLVAEREAMAEAS